MGQMLSLGLQGFGGHGAWPHAIRRSFTPVAHSGWSQYARSSWGRCSRRWTVRSAAAGRGARQGQSATPPQNTDPQTTFRTRIDSVQVDVQVTDKQGNPIKDLTAADFEVRESNKPQAIDTFKYITVDDTPVDAREVPEILSMDDQQRETAKDDARVIVIFLDDYHVRKGNSLAVRGQIANFVRTLNDQDLVAIMSPLTPWWH